MGGEKRGEKKSGRMGHLVCQDGFKMNHVGGIKKRGGREKGKRGQYQLRLKEKRGGPGKSHTGKIYLRGVDQQKKGRGGTKNRRKT